MIIIVAVEFKTLMCQVAPSEICTLGKILTAKSFFNKVIGSEVFDDIKLE
jgi:hypothetical protein